MKLSISMWSVVSAVRQGRIDLPGFIEFAARQQENGARGVELLDYFWRDRAAEMDKAMRQIADAGLELAVYSIGNDFFQPEREAWEKQLADLKTGVDVANLLNVRTMRVFSGNAKPDYAFEDGFAWIVDGLAAGAHYAESHGVTLALENHGLMAGRSDQVRRVIEAVGSPALRANIDTGNFLLVNQNPTEAAQDLADLAALVHLKDFRRARADETEHIYKALDGTAFTGAVVGQGEVELAAIVKILDDAGYDGWLSLEYEGGDDPLTIGVPQSLQAAQKLLQ
ncbi:sugar phosphate isomerase/epimerase family protein [Caldilinea sp.]|uniref:sugar phosphate isomerase/epimerase family protein n=1 Tax=Caldilinea sp. TaxID=2293560 RepID=UPI002CF0741C|nr:sugar phosphate isomerase/epimerase family protein [Caldilinea sp.]